MRTILLALAVVGLAGCPKIGRRTYHFDIATGKGTLTLEDIGTDDPASAVRDFAVLVNEYLLGNKLQEEHPGWRVGERQLIDAGNRLDGRVSFDFDAPTDVGLYQHDRKSGFLWCSEDGEPVVATSGEVIPPYPHCVMFDRKAKQFDVTVSTGESWPSLFPLYKVWDGKEVHVADNARDRILEGRTGESFRDAFGGPPRAEPGPNLSTFLPEVPVPAEWRALGLPLSGSKPVFSSDRTYEASHPSSSPTEVVARYEELLQKAGYSAVSPGSDPSVWTRDGAQVSITATSAGSTVVVDLAR